MKLPTTYKGILRVLIAIAENDNGYTGKLTREQESEIGMLIADIQNCLGEMQPIIKKLKLKYTPLSY